MTLPCVWGEQRNASAAMSFRVVDCVRGNVGSSRGSACRLLRSPGCRQLSGFDVSPSGKRVLMFQPTGDSLHLVVMDLEARTSRLALASDPERFFFNWCVFDADDRIVCSVAAYIELVAVQNSAFQVRRYLNSRATVTRLFAVDPDGGNFTQLVPDSVTRADEQFVYNPQQQDRIVNWLPDDPDHVLIQLARSDPNLPDVYKLDTRKNKLQRIVKYRAPILSWDASEAGTVLLGTGLSGSDPVAFVRDRGNFRQRPIQASVAIDVFPNVLGFASDDRTAYVAMDAGDGRRAVYAVDAVDLHTTATVFADAQYDVFPRLIRDSRSWQPVGLVYERDDITVVWFDAGWRQRFDAIGKALPGATNVPISWSRDGNVVVLVSTSPTTVPTYYLYDATAKKLVKFGAGYPEIPPTSVVERRPVTYTARDGMTIPAYLARAAQRRCEASSDRHPSTRRTLPARYRRLRLLGSVLRQPRLRRAATELPRLDRLWNRAFESGIRAVGREDAGRRHRWCRLVDRTRHHRPNARMHRRRQLRWVCRAGRCLQDASRNSVVRSTSPGSRT